VNRGTEALWTIADGFAFLCDCGATTHVHVSFVGPDGASLPPPQGQITLPEQAITCDGCGSAHWLTLTAKSSPQDVP
jgi:hypothetical protein